MHIQRRGVVLWLDLLLMLVVILTTFVACWGSPTFKLIVENQTKYDLTIYVNNYEIGTVGPGEEISDLWDMNVGKFRIEAKNAEGDTVFSKIFTFEQMQRIENKRIWKVVIPSSFE
jgi:hypothetical protein